jgi:CRP-like cAMP-binding protein
MYEKLFYVFEQLVVLSTQQREDICKLFKPRYLPKDYLLLEQGDISSDLHFLVEGAVRQSYYQDGKEITSGFGFEGDFVNSLYSFVSRKPSIENIVLIADCQLLTITYEGLQCLYEKDPVWNKLGRLIMERYYIQLEERLFRMQSQSASERYHDLLANHPEIVDRVKLGHLASYLGVTQETLSRIRSRYRNRQRFRNSSD